MTSTPPHPDSTEDTVPKPSVITAPERLFSLVLALVATDSGLTKADILQNVQGYRQRYASAGSNESLERQFERDKDDLRELGIPLETFEPPDDPGSNHFLRYRIPKGLYDLPADVTFTPSEVSLLKLAGTVWREGSLSGESRRALMKLNSLGIEPSEPVLGYAPLLRTRDASFEPLSQALDRAEVVAFLYLKPGETTPARRVVAPRALVQHEGRWHLYATDEAVHAPRTFLLARIVGSVAVVSTAVAVASATPGPVVDSATDSARALAELEALWAGNIARLTVVPGSDAAVRLGARQAAQHPVPLGQQPTGVERLLHFTDLNILADELAGFGPEVFVVSPLALRTAVETRLLAARDAHVGRRPAGSSESTPRRRTQSLRARSGSASQPRVAGDQLTLLLSLVPYLIDQGRVSVTEVAEHFDLSAERVRGLVSLIALSGIPGETRQYLHGDLFDILWDEFETNDRIVLTHQVAIDDSPRFSAREAAALIAGLQYLSALPDNADTDAIASLMAKLTRSASAPPIQVGVAQRDAGITRDIVQTALSTQMQVEFDYLNARGGQQHRLVDPLRIESVDNDWYLRGWCHLREAVRTFRLDRMSEPRVTDVPRSTHPADLVLPDTLFQTSTTDVDVRLELPTTALPLLADYRPERAEPVGSGERTRTTLRVAHSHALKRLVTGLAGIVTVLEPAESRQAVADWAAAGFSQYAADHQRQAKEE
ncbi:WYL domain-containing protein [Cryobacterium sp. PH31-L1]|uniref:helix-turn-helix transcriptional regulator n=1 Tax=Cryobacterium sp. PH31-L1 TaxID=3046199 RepID=UPI0024BB5BF5|nr:WYL domain-containing protein [Cryobacterium sp. PH31-L1]MDJ0377702.1 WYL domain-containing protein [Cryobacterium sp. PH31-L1]